MSFFDSLTPVSQYQAQAVAKEVAPRSAIPAMPTPQPMQGYAKGGLTAANENIKQTQIMKVIAHYFKNMGIPEQIGMMGLQKEMKEGLKLIPFESSVMGYKPLEKGVAQIHFFTVGTAKDLADDMRYFYKYLKDHGVITVYDSLPAPITTKGLTQLGAKVEKSDNPKFLFKASI
jgi:hypothetical protein